MASKMGEADKGPLKVLVLYIVTLEWCYTYLA